jgi:hypothetical protein
MYLLVSCQYLHVSAGIMSVYAVCVAITRQLHQKCLSMKCRYVHVSECICRYIICICMYVFVCVGILIPCSQDFVSFIPPPPHYRGSLSAFSPARAINQCWYGRVNLIFKMLIRTDAGSIKECQCALIETLYDYCPGQAKNWWPNTAQIGTKPRMYLPSPEPVVYVVHLSHILGKLPLIPAGTRAPSPEACTAARTRAIHWACAIVRASQATTVPCSTSTRLAQ